MDSSRPPYTSVTWQRAFATIAHVSGGLSVFGSSWIIMEVLTDEKKRARVYHRLLLGMSAYDAAASLWIFLSSWPLPAGTWYGAVGNEATCGVQGFFLTIGLATPIYNSSLSLYYLLQFKYGWSDRKFAQRLEKWVHVLAGLVPLILAVAQIPLDMYHTEGVGPWCTGMYPYTCELPGEDCSRATKITFYIVNFCLFGIVWVCTIFSGACMIVVYKTVRDMEKRIVRYTVFALPQGSTSDPQSGEREKVKRSHQVAVLGMLYMAAYFLTWTFPSVGVILLDAGANIPRQGRLALLSLSVTLYPLQGFFNFLIYIRPRFVKYAKEHPLWSRWRVMGKVCQRPLCHMDDGDDRLGTTADDFKDDDGKTECGS